jgi:hypothetical protein
MNAPRSGCPINLTLETSRARYSRAGKRRSTCVRGMVLRQVAIMTLVGVAGALGVGKGAQSIQTRCR